MSEIVSQLLTNHVSVPVIDENVISYKHARSSKIRGLKSKMAHIAVALLLRDDGVETDIQVELVSMREVPTPCWKWKIDIPGKVIQ
jgi:hypothetical protein